MSTSINNTSDKSAREPHFSIIVPVYNAEDTLGETIESVFAQRFDDFELIIVDDGSNDNSLSLAQSFAETDNRIQVFSKENGGTASAYNFGIERAHAMWIVMLSADDWLADDHLVNICDELDSIEVDCDLVTTAGWLIFEDGSKKEEGHLSLRSVNNGDLVSSDFGTLIDMVNDKLFAVGAAFTKAAWKRVGGFDTRFFAEDWWFFLRIIATGGTWLRISSSSSYHRISATQKSSRSLLVRESDYDTLVCLVREFQLAPEELDAVEIKRASLKKNIAIRRLLYLLIGFERTERTIRKVRGH